MKGKIIKVAINLTVFLGSFVFSIACFELLVNWADLDTKALKPTLFFDCVDFDIYQKSDNAEMLYEILPNKSKTYSPANLQFSENYRERTVSTNSLGFRDYERKAEKDTGVYRIFMLGGSNVYGAAVNNEDAYPQIMQRMLNEKYPKKFEVWNAGMLGYVTSQKVAFTKEIIAKYNPDLVIIQLDNWGRRGFFCGSDYIDFFHQNKELYPENLPFLFSDNPWVTKIHYFMVDKLRSYRFIIAKINAFTVEREKQKGNVGNYQQNKKFLSFHNYGEDLGVKKFEQLAREYPKANIVVLDNPTKNFPDQRFYNFSRQYENIKFIKMPNDRPDKEQYWVIHPPYYVYYWYADNLVKILEDNNFFKE